MCTLLKVESKQLCNSLTHSHTECLLVLGEVLDHEVDDVDEGDHSEGPDIPAKCAERDNDLERAKGAGWFASHCGLVRGAATLKMQDLAVGNLSRWKMVSVSKVGTT